jgi:ribosomal protein S18 acetylase RimI-like enzyme
VLDRIDGRTAVFLYEVGVASDARRRGLGWALVEEATRIGREDGAFEMYVLTEPENAAANGLYAATGAESDTSVMWTRTLA